MILKKISKINVSEKEGENSINNFLNLTKEKKKIPKSVEDLKELGIIKK